MPRVQHGCPCRLPQVGSVSELRISMRRLGAFLSLPEPPEPWHTQKTAASGADGSSAKGGSGSGSRGRRVHTNGNRAVQNGHAPATATTTAAAGGDADEPAVDVAAADFDWTDRSWAAGVPAAAAANGSAVQPADTAAGASASASGAFHLRRLQFAVPRGQLVAIVGAVGTGK